MSMDRCQCGELVDADEFPEAYVLTPHSIGKPKVEQRHECLCHVCYENLCQNISEEEWEARTA